jgi:hypothetical protein
MAKDHSARQQGRFGPHGTFRSRTRGIQQVSLVEGIVLSPGLRADLRRLADAPLQQRRDVLFRRYGKK